MSRKRVFIGMETSGAFRRRFVALGFDVLSCDLLQADDGETARHIQGDVFAVLDMRARQMAIEPARGENWQTVNLFA